MALDATGFEDGFNLFCEVDSVIGWRRQFLALFRMYYGPTMNAFEAAAANGREADLQAELAALFNAHNRSGSDGSTSIPATFLLVSVTR